MHRQIFLDTETTGLNATQGDRIVEIGCVELLGRRLTKNNLHLYINPERDIPKEAEDIHGLSAERLKDEPKFADVAQRFLQYIAGAELIIHNAPFDVGFLDAELERAGLPPLHEHVAGIVDTLEMARQLYPGKRNSLDALCERLGVDNSQRTLHGALLDAELLADVYVALTRGQESLAIGGDEAAAAGAQRQRADFSALQLPVLRASAEELAAHEAVLAVLDKEAGEGGALWRQLESAAPAQEGLLL
ncbi:MAG: DNA polymerase III subunit epsilon [Ottowia sp.]|nr:DNA polymerase III subunit epsilon [Ottowia sp.]